MKLTAVLVNYRDLVGVGKCAEGQSNVSHGTGC